MQQFQTLNRKTITLQEWLDLLLQTNETIPQAIQLFNWARINMIIDQTADLATLYESMKCHNSTNIWGCYDVQDCNGLIDVWHAQQCTDMSNCHDMTNSNHCLESSACENSQFIFSSQFITNSQGVIQSSTITDSHNILYSTFIQNCTDILHGTNLNNCTQLQFCIDCEDTYFSRNCHKLQHSFFCCDTDDGDYLLFNQPYNPSFYKTIKTQYDKLIKSFKYVDTWETKVLQYEIPESHINPMYFLESQSTELWAWVRTLPHFDTQLMYRLTYLPEFTK